MLRERAPATPLKEHLYPLSARENLRSFPTNEMRRVSHLRAAAREDLVRFRWKCRSRSSKIGELVCVRCGPINANEL